MSLNEVLTSQEAAMMIGVSSQTLISMIKEKKIRANKIGKGYKIPVSEVDRILGVNIDSKDYEKELKIKELEGKVKQYELVISSFRSMLINL